MRYFPIWLFIWPVIGFLNWLLRKKVKPNTRKKITIAGFIVAAFVCIIMVPITYSSIFSDSYYAGDHNWCEKHMMYDELFEISTGDSQKIALIDSGISEFQNEEDVHIENLIDNQYDKNGHGTMMFSLIKGYEPGENTEEKDLRILGIAPSVQILSIKVTSDFEGINADVIADAIQIAIDNNATIINLSIGSSQNNDRITKKINEAIQKGITIVCAAGDYGNPDLVFPSNLNGVISVGALDEDSKEWVESNAPKDCDILAPGVNVNSLDNEKKLINSDGTSQATALISGYVALLKDYAKKNNVDIDNGKIIEILHKINKETLSYKEGLKSIL